MGNFEGEKGPTQDMPGHVRRPIFSKWLSRGQNRYGANADWGVLAGVYIGATWRLRMSRPCAAAMRPYVELLQPFIFWVYCSLYRAPKGNLSSNWSRFLHAGRPSVARPCSSVRAM